MFIVNSKMKRSVATCFQINSKLRSMNYNVPEVLLAIYVLATYIHVKLTRQKKKHAQCCLYTVYC